MEDSVRGSEVRIRMSKLREKISSACGTAGAFLRRTVFRPNPVTRTIARLAAPVCRLVKMAFDRFLKFVEAVRKLEAHPFLFAVGLSFILYLIVEMLGRRSVISGIEYLFTNPVVFIFNWLLVLATLSVPLLFKWREFMTALISIIWIGLGLTNCILLGFRTTPLNATDFNTFKDVMGIMTVYFSNKEIFAMFAGAFLTLALIVFIFIKSQRDVPEKHKLAKALGCVAGMFALVFGATSATTSLGVVQTTFHNIQDAYKDYGFAYCFACSVVDQGIDRPKDYSQYSVQSILDEINANGGDVAAEVQPAEKATKQTPNIITLQMESFFDVKHLKGVTYSEDPVPNFTAMKENYTSGILTVPSFGAGTANTEFEVNTGMSMDFFGPGEYPYTTILRETTGESVAYDLKEMGYSSHAIHNHTGRFYGRNWVYPDLGFDSFTSVEYMNDVERNPLDWAKDFILTGEITKALESTEGPDYVFAVSVQGHGKYPSEVIDDTQTITVQGFNEEEAVGFEYYCNQIHQMDQFLGELTDALSRSDEPTVLVIYGDHLPKFDFEADQLDNGSLYETEYVMWDNYGLEQHDKDITTYQLSAYVEDLIGLHNGVMTQFQQRCSESDTYYNDMHTLQYDILYGNCFSYGGTKPFVATDMQFGIDPISITGIKNVEDTLLLNGQNFTKASKIFVDGTQISTLFLSPGHIMTAEDVSLDEGSVIEVVQMSSKKTHLSTTQAWIWDEQQFLADVNSLPQHNGNKLDAGSDNIETVNGDVKDMKAEG